MKKINQLAGSRMKMRFQNICLVLFTLIAGDAFAFNIGDHVETTGTANVRSTPAGSPPLGTQGQGVIGTITGGPTVATLSGTSYTWYDINFPSSPSGWVASINLESAPPTVTTVAATSVTATSAMLNSTVYPNSSSTSIYFQWGTSAPAYGNQNTAVSIGTSSGNYGYTITGLTPNTTYHFRINAYNGTGLSQGSDLTFTTPQQLFPNLTPYQPSGWSDKIVVSRTSGSTTDSTSLTTADTLYVGAAVINNGTAATANNFENTIFVDGVGVTYWVSPSPLGINSYSYTTGYSIGQLTAGTHTITVTADYGGTIAESNEGDNSYTKTISVSTALPDLITQNLQVSPTNGNGGSTVNISFTITNQGTATAGISTCNVRISTSSTTATTSDPLLFSVGVPSLNAGQTLTVNQNVTIPSTQPTGQNYIWAIEDVNNTAGQGANNEANDKSNVPFTLTNAITTATVSAALSALTIAPSSAPADGASTIVAKATLRDTNNNPVSGKYIKFYSGNSAVQIIQPTSPTDANGQTTASMKTTTPLSTFIWAIDTTDSIVIQQQPTIQFTSAFVSPGSDLSNAIVQLATTTSSDLSPYIGNLALDEGQDGDYFQGQIMADNAQEGVIIITTEIGGLLPLIPGTDNLFLDVGRSVFTDTALDDFGQIMVDLAGDSTGLSSIGQAIANNNNGLQQQIQSSQQALLAGIPPTSLNFSAAFTNDLQQRFQANQIIKLVLINQDSLLQGLKSDSDFNHTEFLSTTFKAVNAIGTGVGVIFTTPIGGIYIGESLNAGESLINQSINNQNLNADQKSYLTSITSLISCSRFSNLIYSNTASAFNEIAQGSRPNPVTGQILGITSQLTYLANFVNPTWVGADPDTTTPVSANLVSGGFSIVTVTNTGSQPATFSILGVYHHTITLTDFLIPVPSPQLPFVISAVTNIAAGQTAQVQINYSDGFTGILPDTGSQVAFYALGCNGNNNQDIFKVDATTSSFQLTQPGGVNFSAKIKSNGTPLDENSSTNAFTFETPIREYIYQNSSNQTYVAQILVANPFAVPLTAIITQPLPSGITILSADGSLQNSSLVWTNVIPTNGLVEETFTFTLSTTPGAQTNLPAATLLLSDATGTNTLSVQSIAPNFNGLFPVQVNGFIPSDVFGTDSAMQLTITNFTGTSQSGSLTVTLTDSSGNAVTNFSQSFFVNGSGSTNLNFILPGSLSAGAYSVVGSISMDGGTSQVLAGNYVVQTQPVTLGVGSPAIIDTNGFHMMLNGPLGSNYVFIGSSDLSDPTSQQAISACSPTNMPASITVPIPTNASQMFYRVLMQ